MERIITERIRNGYVGRVTTIVDETGTQFSLKQLNRGKSRGVFVAVTLGPGRISIGWSLLSPHEPEFKTEYIKKDVQLPNNKTKTVTKIQHVKNIDWRKATALATRRARGEELNPPLPAWAESQRNHFIVRCHKLLNTAE
jgi:hypothetical protein